MQTVRLICAVSSALLLASGYLASLVFYFQGRAPQYTQLMDESPIKYICLVLFLAAVILSFVPDKEAETE